MLFTIIYVYIIYVIITMQCILRLNHFSQFQITGKACVPHYKLKAFITWIWLNWTTQHSYRIRPRIWGQQGSAKVNKGQQRSTKVNNKPRTPESTTTAEAVTLDSSAPSRFHKGFESFCWRQKVPGDDQETGKCRLSDKNMCGYSGGFHCFYCNLKAFRPMCCSSDSDGVNK